MMLFSLDSVSIFRVKKNRIDFWFWIWVFRETTGIYPANLFPSMHTVCVVRPHGHRIKPLNAIVWWIHNIERYPIGIHFGWFRFDLVYWYLDLIVAWQGRIRFLLVMDSVIRYICIWFWFVMFLHFVSIWIRFQFLF